jgi:hypothetical protein
MEIAPWADREAFPDPGTHVLRGHGGWTLQVFTTTPEQNVAEDCVIFVPAGAPRPDVLPGNAYEDKGIWGFFHGADCALSLWVADSLDTGHLGSQPHCQRLASGGYFKVREVAS